MVINYKKLSFSEKYFFAKSKETYDKNTVYCNCR